MAEVFTTGVVGAGYVGLATAACLSHLGHSVVCVDKDEKRVRVLEEGRVPFYEPALEELVSRGVHGQRLSFATPEEGLPRLVGETDVVFIAVDTPQGEDGSADLSNVGAVARSIGRALAEAPARRERPLVVVNKSTVPVGSGDYVSMLIREGLEVEDGPGVEGEVANSFLVASNPEFLREGSAIYDSLFPDRIVVGANSKEAIDTLRALYEPINRAELPYPARPPSQGSGAVCHHGPGERGDDQVRLKRLSRDQDQLHQRSCHPLRAGRR